MVIVIGTIVLLPMYALLNQMLLRRDPTVDAADTAKQLRLFRSTMAEDWAAAKVIKVGADETGAGVAASGTECNLGNLSANVPGNTMRIAIQTSGSPSRRIIYNTRLTPSTTDDPAAIDIIRRECAHRPEIISGADVWQLGGNINSADPASSQAVVVTGVKKLVTPTTCNTQAADWPKSPPAAPYQVCDMNVTVIGFEQGQQTSTDSDNPSSTARLYQHTGRDS